MRTTLNKGQNLSRWGGIISHYLAKRAIIYRFTSCEFIDERLSCNFSAGKSVLNGFVGVPKQTFQEAPEGEEIARRRERDRERGEGGGRAAAQEILI